MLFKSGVDILLQQGSINLDNLILLIYIVAGLLTAVINYLFGICFRNINVNKIKKEYPSDKIEYFYIPLIGLITFAQFCVGVYIAYYILSYFVFTDFMQIHSNLGMLYIKAFYGIFAFCFALVLTSYTVILTNKRIIGVFLLDILKRTQVLYSEIKEIQVRKNKISVYPKDKSAFPLVNRKESRICFERLKKLLESEKLNIKIS